MCISSDVDRYELWRLLDIPVKAELDAKTIRAALDRLERKLRNGDANETTLRRLRDFLEDRLKKEKLKERLNRD
jgi:hypothetical protein